MAQKGEHMEGHEREMFPRMGSLRALILQGGIFN